MYCILFFYNIDFCMCLFFVGYVDLYKLQKLWYGLVICCFCFFQYVLEFWKIYFFFFFYDG